MSQTSLSLQHVSATLIEAVQEKTQQFNDDWQAHRDGDNGDALLEHLSKDCDFHEAGKAYSFRNIEKELRLMQADFTKAITRAKTVDDIYAACVEYIESEVDYLAYFSNDLAAARIKRDYFNQCLDGLLPLLDDAGLLDDAWDEKFARLRPAYDYGLKGYEALQAEVHYLSDGKTRGLLHYCSDEIAHLQAENPDRKDLPNPKNPAEMEQLAINMAWDMLEPYGIERAESERGPHLMLYALAEKANDISAARIALKYEGSSPEDLKANHLKEIDAERKRLIHDSMQILQKDNGYSGMLAVKELLDGEAAELYGVPTDFDLICSTTLRSAEAHVEEHCQDYLSNAAREAKSPPPRSAYVMSKLLPELHSTNNFRKQWRTTHRRMRDYLSSADSLERYLGILESATNEVIENTFFGGAHPAMLHALQDYLEHTRRTMSEDLLARGYDAGDFAKELTKLETKCEKARESHLITQDWLMEQTADAYDNLYVKAVMRKVNDTGVDPEFFAKDGDESHVLAMNAAELLQELQSQRNIPASVCGHPLVPVLYQTCLDIAQTEASATPTARENREARGYRDIIAARATMEEPPEADAGQLNKRALQILENALKMLPESAMQPNADGEGQHLTGGGFTGGDLHRMTEYLDKMQRVSCGRDRLN